MKISIITVVFNNAKTIHTAIESVLAQDYADIEYVIVDGKSTDGTLEVIHSYANRIQKIVSAPDLGIYDAMNKGISLCTGEVIGILNSDDVYASNQVISTVMNAFKTDQNLDIVYGNLEYVTYQDVNKVVRVWNSAPYYANFFEDGHVPPHPSLFIKKAVYNQVEPFNLNFKLAADYEFMLRLFKKFQFNHLFINALFVKMRLGGATNASFKNILDGNKEIMKAWRINHLRLPFFLMPKRMIKRLSQFIK